MARELLAWLDEHPPPGGPHYAATVYQQAPGSRLAKDAGAVKHAERIRKFWSLVANTDRELEEERYQLMREAGFSKGEIADRRETWSV